MSRARRGPRRASSKFQRAMDDNDIHRRHAATTVLTTKDSRRSHARAETSGHAAQRVTLVAHRGYDERIGLAAADRAETRCAQRSRGLSWPRCEDRSIGHRVARKGRTFGGGDLATEATTGRA
jgi:hypothetical protein